METCLSIKQDSREYMKQVIVYYTMMLMHLKMNM